MNSSSHNSSMKATNHASLKSNSQRRYSGRITRPRSNSRVYTPGHRENRKWMRTLTAFSYIFFVSSPAVFLSYYYIVVWDPTYVEKYHPYNFSKGKLTSEPKPTNKMRRELEETIDEKNVPFRRLPVDFEPVKADSCSCQCAERSQMPLHSQNQPKLDLNQILTSNQLIRNVHDDTIRDNSLLPK